jgi:hypothetical protein
MATVNWEAFTERADLIPTGLDNLADTTLSVASAVLDNGANLDTHCIVEVELDSVTHVSPAYLEIYMIKALDGSTYEEAPVIGGTDRNTLIATIPVPAGAGARIVTSGLITLPPCPVKFYVGNQCGVTFNNSTPTNKLNVHTANLASA